MNLIDSDFGNLICYYFVVLLPPYLIEINQLDCLVYLMTAESTRPLHYFLDSLENEIKDRKGLSLDDFVIIFLDVGFHYLDADSGIDRYLIRKHTIDCS